MLLCLTPSLYPGPCTSPTPCAAPRAAGTVLSDPWWILLSFQPPPHCWLLLLAHRRMSFVPVWIQS